MSSYRLGEIEDLYPEELLIGVDEAGTGALAGPMAAAAVVWDMLLSPNGINDSKKLTEVRRASLAQQIKDEALYVGCCMLGNKEIDTLGMKRAGERARRKAVLDVLDQMAEDGVTAPTMVVVDGDFLIGGIGRVRQKSFPKGDQRSWSIAAASIIAKECRDDWMRKIGATRHTGYGFRKHHGYGTRMHMEKLLALGPCDIHRRCMKPIRALLP